MHTTTTIPLTIPMTPACQMEMNNENHIGWLGYSLPFGVIAASVYEKPCASDLKCNKQVFSAIFRPELLSLQLMRSALRKYGRITEENIEYMKGIITVLNEQ